MSTLSLTLPTIGQPDSTEDPKLNTALTTIQTWANGNVDGTNAPLLADSGWQLFSYTNSWTNQANAAYRKIGNKVYLRGAVTTGATATSFATLPVGYRPAVTTSLAQTTNAAQIVMVLSVATSGTLTPNFSGGSIVFLDGLFVFTD